jgi:hypothetical protein
MRDKRFIPPSEITLHATVWTRASSSALIE